MSAEGQLLFKYKKTESRKTVNGTELAFENGESLSFCDIVDNCSHTHMTCAMVVS